MHKLTQSLSPARQHLLATRAAEFRRFPSEAEAALWRELRAGKLGVLFRRQVVVGSYILDFLAPEVRLAVEVDGAQHALRRTADARRDRNLARLGYRVLRLEARLVMRDLPRAVALVRDTVGRSAR